MKRLALALALLAAPAAADVTAPAPAPSARGPRTLWGIYRYRDYHGDEERPLWSLEADGFPSSPSQRLDLAGLERAIAQRAVAGEWLYWLQGTKHTPDPEEPTPAEEAELRRFAARRGLVLLAPGQDAALLTATLLAVAPDGAGASATVTVANASAYRVRAPRLAVRWSCRHAVSQAAIDVPPHAAVTVVVALPRVYPEWSTACASGRPAQILLPQQTIVRSTGRGTAAAP